MKIGHGSSVSPSSEPGTEYRQQDTWQDTCRTCDGGQAIWAFSAMWACSSSYLRFAVDFWGAPCFFAFFFGSLSPVCGRFLRLGELFSIFLSSIMLFKHFGGRIYRTLWELCTTSPCVVWFIPAVLSVQRSMSKTPSFVVCKNQRKLEHCKSLLELFSLKTMNFGLKMYPPSCAWVGDGTWPCLLVELQTFRVVELGSHSRSWRQRDWFLFLAF